MSDFYLFWVASDLGPHDERRALLEDHLGGLGRLAPALPDAWLLALDADDADDQGLNAAVLIEELLDQIGEACRLTIVEIDNIVTYNIDPVGEELLDSMLPVFDYDPSDEEA